MPKNRKLTISLPLPDNSPNTCWQSIARSRRTADDKWARAYPADLSDGAFAGKLHRNPLGRDVAAAELDSLSSKLAQSELRRDMVEGS